MIWLHKNYFGNGKNFGVDINYIEEDEPLGSAGGLYYVKRESIKPLLIINGDVLFDVDLDRMLAWHKSKKADITLFTHPNNHPFDSSIIKTDSANRVVRWYNKEDKVQDYKNRINAGIHIIESKVFEFFDGSLEPVKLDLDRGVIKPQIKNGNVYAYDSPEYIKDMGTPSRYYAVCEDFLRGIVSKCNLQQKQKAVFLDRDGTINELNGFIKHADEISLKRGSGEAIRIINKSGYLAIIITNQPVIARGECTIDGLEIIHNRLETLLGKDGAYVDDIFYCPHHTDKGYDGEIEEYKIRCKCRN